MYIYGESFFLNHIVIFQSVPAKRTNNNPNKGFVVMALTTRKKKIQAWSSVSQSAEYSLTYLRYSNVGL